MGTLAIQSGSLVVRGDVEISVAGPTDFSSVILADGPAGYWRHEDTSGNIVDSSGNGNDLTPTGVLTYSQVGQVDNAINYQLGGTHKASITDAASSNAFDFTGNLSLEAWVYPIGGQQNNGGIIAKNNGTGSAGTHNYTLHWLSSEVPRLQVNIPNPNTNYLVDATGAVTLSTWTHLVGVRDGTNLFMYVNGVLDNTTVIPASALSDVGEPFVLGAIGAIAGHGGRLDEVAVYNYALSPARILAHYDARNLPG